MRASSPMTTSSGFLEMPSGLYFYRLEAGDVVMMR